VTALDELEPVGLFDRVLLGKRVRERLDEGLCGDVVEACHCNSVPVGAI